MNTNTFISVKDRQFQLNGKPYYVIGTNLWYGYCLGATQEGRVRLNKELDLMQSIGINNLRIMVACDKSPLKARLNR